MNFTILSLCLLKEKQLLDTIWKAVTKFREGRKTKNERK